MLVLCVKFWILSCNFKTIRPKPVNASGREFFNGLPHKCARKVHYEIP